MKPLIKSRLCEQSLPWPPAAASNQSLDNDILYSRENHNHMATDAELLLLANERSLRRLAEQYAYAVDHTDCDLMAKIFIDDGVLDSPAGRFEGRDAIKKVPEIVRSRYIQTFHAVLNQVSTIVGNDADAETYCIARHLLKGPANNTFCYEMTIRYQDKFVKTNGGVWLFNHRNLIVDWTQISHVKSDSITGLH